jgi:hypothetical protein
MIAFFRIPILPVLLLSAVAAQPVSVSISPSHYSDGDTIRLDVSAGSVSEPFSEVLSLIVSYSCSGCSFGSGSVPSVSLEQPSWFADDSNWAASHEFSSDRKQYRLTLDRTDSQPRSGYGYLASIGGVIIEIEDILKREAFVSAEVSAASARLAAWPQPARGQVHLSPAGDWELYDLKGRFLRSAALGAALDLAGIPAGLYVARRSGAAAPAALTLLVE